MDVATGRTPLPNWPGYEVTVSLDFVGPAELRTRGTVLVIPGRGESQASYQRFGRRLAADSYRVRVLVAPAIDPDDIGGSLDHLAATLGAAVDGLAHADHVRPLVVVASDSAAALTGALVARSGPAERWWPDAVVLAALPGYGEREAASWDAELDARTHCTAHRGVLSDDTDVHRGALADALPAALLDAAYSGTADTPHLLLVGDQDPYADHDALARYAKSLPSVRVVRVRGAHHDVLNDLQHRSVAATLVTFLESLRTEPTLDPIIAVESSTW
jgi:alpha-beta hydrolase superfamily lysophospholipase